MVRKRMPNLVLENVRIMFRNFAGNPTKFDPVGGKRDFCVAIEDEEVAEQLAKDGWNIKYLKGNEEQELPPLAYMKVKVNFDGRFPPNCVMITHKGRTTLTEDLVSILDWSDILMVDMILNPSFWDVNGKTGVTAYLKSIYVTILEDELSLKYGDVPEVGADREIEMAEQTLQITDGSENEYVDFEER
jgi:hypothetical protein